MKAQGTGHRAQGTGRRAQGAGHGANKEKYRVPFFTRTVPIETI